jgi:hypothetical protein
MTKGTVNTKRAGILMHIRHLETVGWERLVWGVPEEDSIGSLPKVVELLLDEPPCEPIVSIVFGCGPSVKDGLSEGEYTKRYLLERLPALRDFPRFKDRLDDETLRTLRKRLEQIYVTPKIERSIDEVVFAAEYFAEQGTTRVWQVTAASHAPRCVQIQAAVRTAGLIPKDQQWALVADDRSYEGTDPFSTLIVEMPHRGDDPMFGFKPALSELLREYQYGLSPEDKKKLACLVEDFMREHAKHTDIRQFAKAKQ